MTMISYAQNGEDVMLMRALGTVAGGFYIDVGAADPTTHSITRAFYDRGWHGVNIEPSLEHLVRLEAERPRDTNLRIALDDREGEQVFHTIQGTGLSTLDGALAREHGTTGWPVTRMIVATRTLADVCAQYAPATVHFLKIDVEGAEQRVLAGADFARFRPWIVLVEATRPGTEVPNHEAWEHLLLQAGYEFVWFDGLNRFYVAAEQAEALRHAFATPLCVFDQFTRHDPERDQLAAVAATAPALAERAQAAEARAADAERHAAEGAARAGLAASGLEQARQEAEARAGTAIAEAALLAARAASADSLAQAAVANASAAAAGAQAADAQIHAMRARLGDLQHLIDETRRRHDELQHREDAARALLAAQRAESAAQLALAQRDRDDLASARAERDEERGRARTLEADGATLRREIAGLREERAALTAAEAAWRASEAARTAADAAVATADEAARAAPAIHLAPARPRLRRRVASRLYGWTLRPFLRPLAWRGRSFLLAGLAQELARHEPAPAHPEVDQTVHFAELRAHQDRILGMVHRVDDLAAEQRAEQRVRLESLLALSDEAGAASRRIEAALQVRPGSDQSELARSMEAALLTLSMAGRTRSL